MIALEAQLKALMLAALKGDGPAYRLLLKALSDHLRSYYARRLRPGAGDPEDLVQETLMAVHTRRSTYDTAQPLTAWVYAIARYKLIDHLRRDRRRNAVPLEEAQLLPIEADTDALLAAHDLDRLLAQLPERSRELIRQTKLEGLTAQEAAAAAGMSETAVKVGVHRGLKAVAQRIRNS